MAADGHSTQKHWIGTPVFARKYSVRSAKNSMRVNIAKQKKPSSYPRKEPIQTKEKENHLAERQPSGSYSQSSYRWQ